MANYQDPNVDPTTQDSDLDDDQQDTTYQSMIDRIKAARQAAGPEVDQTKFDQLEDQAKQAYQDQASRNEWLSVADRIGNALTRYGAAQAGLKKGVDMTHIDYGPQTDWQGKTAQAAKDYQTQLGSINDRRKAALDQQKENYGIADKALGYEIQSQRDERLAKQAADREAAAADRQDKSLAAQDVRQTRALQAQEEGANKRLKMQQDMEEGREGRAARQQELRDIERSQQDEGKKLKARQELFSDLMTDDDLSGKSADKLQATYGKLAGEAGVDLADVQQKLKAEESGPRIFGGRSSAEDAAAKKKILDQEMSKQQTLLDALAERKRQILGRNLPQEPAAPATPPQSSPNNDTVKVRGPSGQVATMTKEKAQKYLSQPGYSVVP